MTIELIIDPGHGGKDPGGVSRFGHEKDYTLKISLYQYDRFKELGVPVAITRASDVDLGEEARVAAVKNSGAKYCISNHLNAGGGDRAEVVHSIYDDGKLANAIKAQLLAVGQTTVKVYFRKGPNGQDYYYMHRRTGTVATNIVEYCFIDNETDFTHFNNNWEAYAEAVVKAYCTHTGRAYKPRAIPTPQPVKNGWVQENDNWYFYENGAKKTGWLKWDNRWWYLNNDGVMLADQFVKIGEFWYYFYPNGQMMDNVTLTVGDDGAVKV
jgi:N-acetylmuramoyl-L-alanine amidase